MTTADATLAYMRAWRASNERRNDIIHAAHAAGWPINRIHTEMGITRQTIYNVLECEPPTDPIDEKTPSV